MLVAVLCAGVSAAWGEKITDYNNIVSGKKYYIGATTGNTDYYLSVDGGSLTQSIAGTAVANKRDATAFTFVGSEASWSIQFENGYYLSLKNGKDNGKVQVVESASTFTASNQSSTIRLSIGSYSIQKNNSGTQFGSYANTQTDVWLEEVPSVAPTTYTVSFDAGDGTFVGNDDFPNASNSKEAGSYTLPSATPTDGYTFDGWLTSGITTPVTGSYTVSGDVAFTAQYTQNSSGGPQTATLTSTNLELTGSYTTNTEKTINGIKYVFTDLMLSNNRIQAKASTGTIKNVTPYPGDITSVVITHNGTARATTINGSADGENWSQVATGSGSITADFSGKGYKYFQITRGANAAYWDKIEITYSETSLEQSDLTITNAATDLTFDLNNNTEAQVINYTTSSTGEVTISPAESDYFTISHDAENKKITVTPTAVTPGAQTVTIRQAADESYNAGAVTFTVTITDSTPFDGSMFIFNTDAGLTELGITKPETGKGTDLDEEAGYTKGIVTMSITHGGTKTRVWNGSGNTDLRVYKDGGSLTFTVPAGNAITKVTFEGEAVNFDGLTENVWTASGSAVNTVTFTNSATASKISTIKVEYEENNDPIITASDVEIAYNATSGSISYTVNNPVDGGELTATDNADWLTMGEVGAAAVAFTATQNETALTRTAEVVLTYTYGTATTSKTITVTQTGNPDVKGGKNNPYTVSEALEVIAALADNEKTSDVYVKGTISSITEVSVYDAAENTGYGNATYFISDGTNELEVFRGYFLENAKFTSMEQIQAGDEVVVYGKLQKYVKDGNTTLEVAQGNYIVSLDRPETVTATITAAGYATFANEKAVDFSAETGLTVMTAQYDDATGKINYTTVESKKVPAATAVVLKGEAKEYTGTVIDEAPALENNDLQVNLSESFNSNGTQYCLAKKNEVVGFYKVKDGVAVKAGKAYLVITASGAKDFYAIEDETDGINAINNSHQTVESVYNLSGQRVNKAQKGIYIVNGKKVVVK